MRPSQSTTLTNVCGLVLIRKRLRGLRGHPLEFAPGTTDKREQVTYPDCTRKRGILMNRHQRRMSVRRGVRGLAMGLALSSVVSCTPLSGQSFTKEGHSQEEAAKTYYDCKREAYGMVPPEGKAMVFQGVGGATVRLSKEE